VDGHWWRLRLWAAVAPEGTGPLAPGPGVDRRVTGAFRERPQTWTPGQDSGTLPYRAPDEDTTAQRINPRCPLYATTAAPRRLAVHSLRATSGLPRAPALESLPDPLGLPHLRTACQITHRTPATPPSVTMGTGLSR